jgi:hypothetical protein
MDSKNNKEYFNGLLLVCASGIGEDLIIPDNWENNPYAISENALIYDFRSAENNESTIASVETEVSDQLDSSESKPVLEVKIATPKKKLYVGDIFRKNGIVYDTSDMIQASIFQSSKKDFEKLILRVKNL